MDYKLELLSEKVCFKGFFTLKEYTLRHRCFAGHMSPPIKREALHRAHAAAALLYDPDADAVVMIEQFRIGALFDEQAWLVELVAGFIEPDETPEEVIVRESLEEAGCTVTAMEFIQRYHLNPGNAIETTHLYVARVDSRQAGGIHGMAEEFEDILVRVFAADDILASLERGEIQSATPIIGLQWLAQHRAGLRKRWSGSA